jgi:hypothetical protein
MTHHTRPARAGERAPQEFLGKRRGIDLERSDIYILYVIKITSALAQLLFGQLLHHRHTQPEQCTCVCPPLAAFQMGVVAQMWT